MPSSVEDADGDRVGRRWRRGRRWWRRRASAGQATSLALGHMPKTVILGAARTPIGKLGGGLSTLDATELGATAITAALERADVAPEQVEHVVMGQVLQAGQGQIPSRQAQIKAGIPKEVSSETINKVCASGLRASVILDQAIRAGDVEVGVGGGMESMSRRALPAAPGALRLPHGRRQGARRDGPRRPHQPVQRPPDVRRGDRGRRRARAHAPRPRPLGAALARARAGRDRRGPHARGDRRRHGQGSQGRHRRRGRRGPAPRHHARGAGQAARASSARRARTPPATRRASTTAAARWCWPATSGPRPTARRSLAEIVAHAQSANDFAYLATTPAARGREGAGQGRACSRGDIDLWEINEAFASVDAATRSGCSASTRTSVNVNGGAVALGPPDRRLGRAHPRRARARAAPPRRRPRLRGDLLAAAARATRVILKVHGDGA